MIGKWKSHKKVIDSKFAWGIIGFLLYDRHKLWANEEAHAFDCIVVFDHSTFKLFCLCLSV